MLYPRTRIMVEYIILLFIPIFDYKEMHYDFLSVLK